MLVGICHGARARYTATLMALTICGMASRADALCTVPVEQGVWRNADAQTSSLTRIDLRFVCQDQILNGEPYPPGPPWYVHLWGKCHPTDCDWGEVGASRLSSGHIYAVYDQGFAKRYVYAKMSQYRPGQLWVYTHTDFVDPNRADYDVQNWFLKQASGLVGLSSSMVRMQTDRPGAAAGNSATLSLRSAPPSAPASILAEPAP